MQSAAVLPADVAARYPHGYAVVDLETSGLHAAHDRALQIAVMQMAPDGTLQRSWSTLLNPGCDPGPVHIHGLTREMLRGAPQFPDIASTLGDLMDGRVLVAHNARFDWSFLACESSRANVTMPVSSRLCTIALSRRLDLPVPGMSLDLVSAYWGVHRRRAHDAVDDTRVLVEVLRHSLVVAHQLGVTLPFAPCVPSDGQRATPPNAPRPPCAWKYPGRWTPGTTLTQGMKIVFTGETRTPREVLTRDAAAAGLDVMNSVSSRTSLVVRNPDATGTRKAQAAAEHATPIIDETTFSRLIANVAAGEPKTAAAPASKQKPPARTKTTPTRGRLCGCRVIVLGGPHERAVQVRERIAELGGQAAANLTASVTHVVLLDNATNDPRWTRVSAAGRPELDPTTLDTPSQGEVADTPVEPAPALIPAGADTPPEPAVLGHGSVIDLPDELDGWSLAISWLDNPQHQIEIDVVAFVVDADEQIRADEDFCFYNQPTHPSGAVDLELGIANEALAIVRPVSLPDEQRRIVFAAAIDGDQTFKDVGPIELTMRTADGAVTARATLDAATTERSLLLASLYDRNGTWRLRAIGQGYEDGLAHLAVLHGVDIED